MRSSAGRLWRDARRLHQPCRKRSSGSERTTRIAQSSTHRRPRLSPVQPNVRRAPTSAPQRRCLSLAAARDTCTACPRCHRRSGRSLSRHWACVRTRRGLLRRAGRWSRPPSFASSPATRPSGTEKPTLSSRTKKKAPARAWLSTPCAAWARSTRCSRPSSARSGRWPTTTAESTARSTSTRKPGGSRVEDRISRTSRLWRRTATTSARRSARRKARVSSSRITDNSSSECSLASPSASRCSQRSVKVAASTRARLWACLSTSATRSSRATFSLRRAASATTDRSSRTSSPRSAARPRPSIFPSPTARRLTASPTTGT
mmetsp:Transcript_13203/g.41793  ORF Transcript_13203/g.41793 Transcript_13203/m.41793 type:complete len:318 (+) Transcript_13203:252-1205(+)